MTKLAQRRAEKASRKNSGDIRPKGMAAVETGGTKRAVYVPGHGMVDDFMISDNLNECVDALLQKRPKTMSPS